MMREAYFTRLSFYKLAVYVHSVHRQNHNLVQYFFQNFKSDNSVWMIIIWNTDIEKVREIMEMQNYNVIRIIKVICERG